MYEMGNRATLQDGCILRIEMMRPMILLRLLEMKCGHCIRCVAFAVLAMVKAMWLWVVVVDVQAGCNF